MGRKLAPKLLAQPTTCRDELLQVDTRLDLHSSAHPNEVFGRQISASHLRERRAADAAHTRVEDRDALVHRGEDVRESLTVGVVEMKSDLCEWSGRTAEGVQQPCDVAGCADAKSVAERHLVAAEIEQLLGRRTDDGWPGRPIPRIRDDHREIAADAKPRLLRVRDDRSIARERLVARSVQVLSRVALARRGENRHLAYSARPRALE